MDPLGNVGTNSNANRVISYSYRIFKVKMYLNIKAAASASGFCS